MDTLNSIWDLLGMPVDLVSSLTGITLNPLLVTLCKGILALLLIYIAYRVVMSFLDRLRSRHGHRPLADRADIDALLTRDSQFKDKVLAARTIESTAQELKKAKDYLQLAQVYAGGGRHKEAARWFKKAGKRKDAALEWAKAGQPVKAARMLMREGDFSGAARLFAEGGRAMQAANAYQKAGDLAQTAACYAKAGKLREAVHCYADYFASAHEDVAVQIKVAEECFKLLQSETGRKNVPADERQGLLAPLAARFEQAHRHDLAASLFREAGDLVRAGEVFVLAGKFDEAADCMRQAGRPKDAARFVGRFFEAKQQWKDAATAYMQAGEFLRAGDCFAKASDMAHAAECFEKAGQAYRAALAFAHAARYEEAIRLLQRVKESEPSYDQSRVLLGRCFYELHDYPHCAAALDNQLMGKRVTSSTIEYFYMLALAQEQVGKLNEARELFYKIRTVEVAYRDVTQRISNISTRISLQSEMAGMSAAAGTAVVSPAAAGNAAAGMQSVQNSLGGRYQLQEELGRGGMGVVYLAKDSQLDRPVALKFLGSLVDNSEEFRQRFIREARTAARISHPNIISIYDISASVGKAYIAMEYVDGPSLQRYLRSKGRLKAREAVALIEQACAALCAIHEGGIVHRDIKPDNILLAKGGLVKVMDFGLAKAEDSRMTRTGVVMGTPSYMAPEQVLGKEASPRSDIYAMGLVLYECLTGETAFLGGDVLERQLKEVPPPPGSKVEGVPPELDQLVMKCIAKKPEERFQNMREVLAALRKLHG